MLYLKNNKLIPDNKDAYAVIKMRLINIPQIRYEKKMYFLGLPAITLFLSIPLLMSEQIKIAENIGIISAILLLVE